MKRDFTATVYIFHEDRVLLLFHRKLQKWLPPGGHIEPDELPPEAARREVFEETGLLIEFIPQENMWIQKWNAVSFERPYMCLLEEIPAYKDKEAHQHMDLIYLARPLLPIISEVTTKEKIRWFSLEELEKLQPDSDIFEETLEVIKHLFQHLTIDTPTLKL